MILILIPVVFMLLLAALVLDAHMVTRPPKRPHVPLDLTEEQEEELLYTPPLMWEDPPSFPKGEIT